MQTWGKQSDQAQAFAQLDAFVAAGGNFVDTAELYAVPTSAETFGRTEEILGNWITERDARSKIILASKVAGPMAHNRMAAVRCAAADDLILCTPAVDTTSITMHPCTIPLIGHPQ